MTRRRLHDALILLWVAAALWLTVCSAVRADDLAAAIQPLIDAHQGKVGVAITHLGTGESFAYKADLPMGTASLIKFPLMVAAYQQIADGKLKSDQMITLKSEDKVPGSGILSAHFSGGLSLSLRDAIHVMIVYSDNTATNLVIDQVGIKPVAELMEKLGCPETKLNSKVYRRDTTVSPERSQKYGLGSTTAAEMVKLLELLSKGELAGGDKDLCQQMLAHMYACDDKTKIPRFLPPQVQVAHKTGSVADTRCDAALIDTPGGPIAICVLTNDNKDRSWGDNNAAEVLCGRIAQAAYKHFVPEGESPVAKPSSGVLKIGDSGPLVESLQRTLNARMEPSPGLGVDGDFGSMTETAVVAFQKSKHLTADGSVGRETWEALGPLVAEGPAAPDPAVTNSESQTREAADAPDGPPFVTCKTWAIGDGQTGKLLWGSREHEPVDIASTTKIMTAYLVLHYAKDHPEALDETVTFSKRADDTIGSTSGLAAGEQISVRELMYGMLLPSGNDAAVAFAEHFGPRLAAEANDVKGSSDASGAGNHGYDQFIAAMNRACRDLGMTDSHFVNPNGLTEPKHISTAADMLKVTYAALQLPLFAEVVSTRQHGATVMGPGGYKRNVVWKNTNRLLGIEGYSGVKTGTTDAAGCCLVSQCKRGDKSLVAVVLGAPTSDARYADTRNLYRWAWRELAHGEAGGQ